MRSNEDTMACAGCVSPSNIVDDEAGQPTICLVPLRPELHDDCRESIDAYQAEVRRGDQ